MFSKPASPIDFAGRRKSFLAKAKHAVALFPSAPVYPRNPDVDHAYRQESGFFYLTGFEEPESICLLSSASQPTYQLFTLPRDPHRELWEGERLGPERARAHLGADAAFPSTPESVFDDRFVAALLEAQGLYYRVGRNVEWDQRVFRLLERARRKLGRTGRALWPIFDPDEILAEMRLFKGRTEVERMQRAAEISAEAHVNAAKMLRPGLFEYEVEASLHHTFRVHGAARAGYTSIVASGANACYLHYTANKARLEDGDLLLVDAGAEFEYYTADITRVFPVGAAFTEPQREIYSAVLKAQKAALQTVRPGKTPRDMHAAAVEVLVDELKRLKVLKGPAAQLIKRREYVPFYPHGTGHWLGMDVHDSGRYYEGDYATARKFAPGMVITVEPGLYFGAGAGGPARFKGIGVRIEDDVLVTNDGHRVLTAAAPKEIDEVESLRGA